MTDPKDVRLEVPLLGEEAKVHEAAPPYSKDTFEMRLPDAKKLLKADKSVPVSQVTNIHHGNTFSPLSSARYWMSMLSTMLCLQSFVFCVVCFSTDAIKEMADSDNQAMALELTARKIILDVGVLTITIAVGFLLFLTESKTHYSKQTASPPSDTKADDSGSMLSSILVAYKLFQMIVAVDISVRILQGLHVTMLIANLNIVYILLLFVLPVCAASIEVTMTVATFIDMQSAYRLSHQHRILAIS